MTQTTHNPQGDHGPLMSLVAVLLAPMFLSVCGGDLELARMAAFATVNDYRARNQLDLIAIAQIIAFGLAALCVLSLSMEDGTAVPDMLILHGNANALNRSAEQNRRAIRQPQPAEAAAPPQPFQPAATAEDMAPGEFLSELAADALNAESEARLHVGDDEHWVAPPPATTEATEKRHQDMWAIAMVKEASEITASIPNLPQRERSTASIRAAALSSTANQLLTGVGPMPVTPPVPAARTHPNGA